jgi:hypothetical protein
MHRLANAIVAGSFVTLASVMAATPGLAEVVVSIDKSSQRMSVSVDGAPRHSWAVSTGTGGGPPSGVYRPQRLERSWRSRKFGWAPMPHAIFFHGGYAIHGNPCVAARPARLAWLRAPASLQRGDAVRNRGKRGRWPDPHRGQPLTQFVCL